MTKRWHAGVILLGTLAADVGVQVAAWHWLTGAVAVAVVVAATLACVVGIRVLTASYPRHGWY